MNRHLRNVRRLAEVRDRRVWRWPNTGADWTVAWADLIGRTSDSIGAAWEQALGVAAAYGLTATPGDTTETGAGGPGAGSSLAHGGPQVSHSGAGDSVSAEGENDSQQSAVARVVKVAGRLDQIIAEAVEQARTEERKAVAGWLDRLSIAEFEHADDRASTLEGRRACLHEGVALDRAARSIRSGAHREDDRG